MTIVPKNRTYQNMFIPIGGIFIFGNNDTRAGAVSNLIIGLVNCLIGGFTLFIAFINDMPILKVIGFIIAGLGLLMVIFSLFAMTRLKRERN